MYEKLGVVAVILALIACVMGGVAIGIEKEGPIGQTGLMGEQGEVGERGEIGPIGPQGEQGPQGEPGEQGIQGETGSRGPRGYAGLDGKDGKDLEPNDAPTIVMNDSESYVEGTNWHDDYQYVLNISTFDTENDYRHINVYYKDCGGWKIIDSIPYVDDDDYVVVSKELSGNGWCGNRTLDWLVECYDGENLVYLEGNTTLYKPCIQ